MIMNLLKCDLAEVQQAFFNAPCREAERRFHNHAMDLLAEAADSDAWQPSDLPEGLDSAITTPPTRF
ncbi:hypothetical protein ACFXKI_37510 [Streptomyces mirabilis]|uniref:hypothetical protein n=1 Tax=Streptomyces mirabilis TaxID=68239 RepID=UPI0036857C70